MPCQIINDLGKITITEDVIAKIVGNSVLECYGIVAMASTGASDTFSSLIGRESLVRGVRVMVDEDQVDLELHIIVQYSVSIQAVAQSAIEVIRYNIDNMIGITVRNIHIFVEGIQVERSE